MTSAPHAEAPVAGGLRSPAEVLDPRDLGGARATRHSFSRALVRLLRRPGWRVDRLPPDLDAEGRGTAVYRVTGEGHTWHVVVFSDVIDDSLREDRVVATTWDVTLALLEGPVDDARIGRLRGEVTRQEDGRADAGTVIWGRGNRSRRFFDRTVDALAAGVQPDLRAFGLSPYLMRSTAFYSNGKFGLADFERFGPGHPFAVPYRAHFLTAWLMREFSLDLVEHCARARGTDAARLDPAVRRCLGLGNATGLGLVPFVVNHPAILDAWVALREVPLAAVRAREVATDDRDVARVRRLLDAATRHLRRHGTVDVSPWPRGEEVASSVAEVAGLLDGWQATRLLDGTPTDHPWDGLHRAAAARGPACRGVVASVLVELADDLDDWAESRLACRESAVLDPAQSVGDLAALVREHYGWVDELDLDAPGQDDRFWFSSADSEEPRRGRRGVDPGVEVEHACDVARQVHRLRHDLAGSDPRESVARLLVRRPHHRDVITRIQASHGLRFGEVHANLLADDFLPLDLQRLQLAVYGMDNFVPQSTDWLRVTLFAGAPSAVDIGQAEDEDGLLFPVLPGELPDERTDP